MKNTESLPFRFHEALDANFLHDLFAGDLAYAAVVFEGVANELPQCWNGLETAYRQGDAGNLKLAAHKCKTLFAYVGLSSMRERMQAIEAHGFPTDSASVPREEWEQLRLDGTAAEQIVLEEIKRLQNLHAG